LQAGQALLVVANPDSDLSQMVTNYNCGWVVTPGDAEGFHNVVAEALNPEILFYKRSNAYKVGHENFEIKILSNYWKKVLSKTFSSSISVKESFKTAI
jgi:hypothetical protein